MLVFTYKNLNQRYSNQFQVWISTQILQNNELKQLENHLQQVIFSHNWNTFLRFLLINEDDYHHQPRVRRPSIVVREHQLSQYPINYDPSPHIIRKQVDDHREHIVYKQQIAVRYLCPPTPPPPPPLIIREIRPPEPSPLPPSSFDWIHSLLHPFFFFHSYYSTTTTTTCHTATDYHSRTSTNSSFVFNTTGETFLLSSSKTIRVELDYFQTSFTCPTDVTSCDYRTFTSNAS